uniref:non-specific serine/threonine protein kinase n=1 Tax=Kalanchoe fedtschenkoi TaxID=63787 RepID=A0A7N0RH07_KALFE
MQPPPSPHRHSETLGFRTSTHSNLTTYTFTEHFIVKAYATAGDLFSAAFRRDHSLTLDDLTFLRRLGSGDIGTVYLAELKRAPGVLFAAKVMDKEELALRNKEGRAAVEREILEMVDHPFLPRLYASLDSPEWSCLLTDYCPGGDLHVLRQRQPERRFGEAAVRFYASEVVVALEYLHMLGIIYRDLKPENVLVRPDGHIMLTDFDLSLKENPHQHPTSIPHVISGHRQNFSAARLLSCTAGIDCFRPKPKRRGRRVMDMEVVTEPLELRSTSYVGTHEYLAPEIVCGEEHGNAVDWWTLGVFMYELFYGTTPFRGVENEKTLESIVARPVEFPKEPASVPSSAKDLISRLLVKEPEKRMGATTGAAAVRQHPFFSGVIWALLRCTQAPIMPTAGFGTEGSKCEKEEYDSVDYY